MQLGNHVDRDKLENAGSKPINSHSKLPLNYGLAGTYRFGEYGICFVQDTVPDDETPFGTRHNLRSYNMRSPLLSDMKLKKEYIEVPLPAILPLNYEKFITQPQVGEDIDATEVGVNVADFTGYINSLISGLSNHPASANDLNNYILKLIIAERIYSAGSLCASLGIGLHALWPTFDKFFDLFFSAFRSKINESFEALFAEGYGIPFYFGDFESLSISDRSVHYLTPDNLKDFIIDVREGLHFSFDVDQDFWPSFYDLDTFVGAVSEIFDNVIDIALQTGEISASPEYLSKDISLQRLYAYQLACAEFFTDSHVDDIYSAELYRQNIHSLMTDSDAFNLTPDYFVVNGIQYQYDTLSAHNFKRMISSNASLYLKDSLLRLIFGYNRSLRYKDYFVGSRPWPLAVGDVNVAVNNGYVNVVDTIEKRWYAKFLNQVNRAQRRLSDYTRKLFPNLVLSRDRHDPLWLAATEDNVDSPEIENTGVDQFKEGNSTTSVFRSSGGQYVFEYHSEYYGTIIGLEYFDCKRFYSGVIERPVFFVDRNDYFNPFLQMIGDQEVYSDELSSALPHSTTFGYKGRYMEYKERVDQAFGGFANGSLKGWLYQSNEINRPFGYIPHISSEFIRSRQTELDEFFPAVSGYSLGTYFHFIIVNQNLADNVRPMIANPQLD